MTNDVIRLRGMDYFQVLIDHHIKKHGGIAHQARIFILLDGIISRKEVDAVIHENSAISWICNLRLRFTRFQAYARILTHAGQGAMPISELTLHPDESWESYAETCHADLAEGSPVYLQLFHFQDGRTGMLFTFNHILFDYQGIEHFLKGFSGGMDVPLIGNYVQTEGFLARTKEFFQAIFYAFRQGDRSMFSTGKNWGKTDVQKIEYHTTSLTGREIGEFKSCVSKKGLELQESIYLMAISAMVVYHYLGNAESRQRKMLFQLPVTTRTRRRNEGVLFNALSFFYFNLDPHLMDDLDLLIERVSGQMKEQIKAGLPRSFLTFSDLYKMIPFKIYSWMLGLPTRGQLGSFNVSILGNTFKDMDQFMGRSIQDVMNFPSNTIQPGLTVVFYYFKGEFRITTSWVKGLHEQKEQMRFHHLLKEELRGLGVITKGLE